MNSESAAMKKEEHVETTDDARARLLSDPQVHEMIAMRAYEIFQIRGGEPGHDAEDWFIAENEIVTFLMQEESRCRAEAAMSGRPYPAQPSAAAEPVGVISPDEIQHEIPAAKTSESPASEREASPAPAYHPAPTASTIPATTGSPSPEPETRKKAKISRARKRQPADSKSATATQSADKKQAKRDSKKSADSSQKKRNARGKKKDSATD